MRPPPTLLLLLSITLVAAWPWCPEQNEHYFDASTARDFNVSLMIGDWYEAINSVFGNKEKCARHRFASSFSQLPEFSADIDYSMGYVKYFRNASDGPVHFYVGHCDTGSEKVESMRKIFYDVGRRDIEPFWIYKVGPVHQYYTGNNCQERRSQYEYMVVSSWVRDPVVVLVRDLEVYRTHFKKEVVDYLNNEWFPRSLMRYIHTDNASCEITDEDINKTEKDMKSMWKNRLSNWN